MTTALEIPNKLEYKYKDRTYIFTKTNHNYGDLDVLNESGNILKTTKWKQSWWYEEQYGRPNGRIHQKCSLKRISKRIFMTMKQIAGLSSGRIKEYQVFYELELLVLSDFLRRRNILHTITIWEFNQRRKICEFTYPNDEAKLLEYMDLNRYPERNKVLRDNTIFVKIYKGFVNLCEKKIYSQDYKFGVYIC